MGHSESPVDIFNVEQLNVKTISDGSGSSANTISLVNDLTFANNIDLHLGTSAGTKIGKATNQKLGFWDVTPVDQPEPLNVSGAGFTQNTGTALLVDSDFTGNNGSNAYTVSEIVASLKECGILKA